MEHSHRIVPKTVRGSEETVSEFMTTASTRVVTNVMDAKRDTLTIIKTTKKPKNEHSVDFGIYKEYKTAKMKLDGKYYEITLTKPVKKDSPSKVVMLIDKDKYYFREMKTKHKGVSMTMRMTKIKIGVSDDAFKLDLNKYPKAVVVRK